MTLLEAIWSRKLTPERKARLKAYADLARAAYERPIPSPTPATLNQRHYERMMAWKRAYQRA